MRVVLQRVSACSVAVDGKVVGAIGPGLFALVGVAPVDSATSARALAAKIANLRVFADSAGKMNRSVLEAGGAVLVVSQFTLLADLSRGRRPFFGTAADPSHARKIIDELVVALRAQGLVIETGVFGADMKISIQADGPVTILLDS